MTGFAVLPIGGDPSVAAYEKLRRHVLAGTAFGSPSGWSCCCEKGWPPGCRAVRLRTPRSSRPRIEAACGRARRVRRDPRQRRAGAGQHGLAWPGRDELMSMEAHQKVSASHLKRSAYLYVRQSTMRQVIENTESTQRQYALRQRAVALGWPDERVIVIDTDLGQSGASAADREGFQKLVAEVGMGRAGIVLGLEVSRLARNSTDWHRLLEICALTDTLILDEDGLYDPAHFNDRLLLGLKGTMSEAELHVFRARLHGGHPEQGAPRRAALPPADRLRLR